MLITYSQCLEKHHNDYQIQKAVSSGALFKIEPGIYSDKERVSELAVVVCKYPETIVTMNSAFYYHGLTDVIPEQYYLATKKSSRCIKDPRVKQVFVPEDIFTFGIASMQRRDALIQIYDKERMLIELLRFKNLMPFDYYKEILNNYREIVEDLDIPRIEEYAKMFPKSKMIMRALKYEVF
ncbi:MAG: hypothetical protein Q4E99_03210 [Bacillota bacterium]|nr:hypothetical protein [Bacillota bacterium]